MQLIKIQQLLGETTNNKCGPLHIKQVLNTAIDNLGRELVARARRYTT